MRDRMYKAQDLAAARGLEVLKLQAELDKLRKQGG
jgi:hypothetical protein